MHALRELSLPLQVVDLRNLDDIDAGVSLNVGVIHGGTQSNVKAEYAEAEIDFRFMTTEQGERLVKTITDQTEQVVSLFHVLEGIAKLHGYEVAEGLSGGGSDGNLTAALGIPTSDGVGPVGDGAHARNEHIELENLPYRAALLAELMAHQAAQ